jgi:putative cell wall-binding protein
MRWWRASRARNAVARAVVVLSFGLGSLGLALTVGPAATAAPDESGGFISSGPLTQSWQTLTSAQAFDAIAPQLVGGSPAGAGEFPWMTYLLIERQSGGFSQCGGSLIASRWVLTAAHCLEGAVAIGAIVGRTTAPGSLSDPAFVFAFRSFINSGYVPGAFGVADVGLIELTEASSKQPIFLARPSDSALYPAGTMATVTGWGLTAVGGQSSDVLLKGALPIRSSADCFAAYAGFDATFNTCAGYSSTEASQPVGSCRGDSGGPLFVPSAGTGVIQVGAVSYGTGDCTSLERPGVYMRLSAFYDGINDLVGGLPARSAAFVRWAGADRYATSVRISQAAFPSGADTVFLATGQSFPDALAAGPAAATRSAPILLTSANQLPTAVSAELKRLNPSVIYLLGGTAAISGDVAKQVDAVTTAQVRRIAGNDRYDTAAAVTELAFPTADTVYVAAGSGFADALSAGSPGGILGRPVLLTAGTSVPAPTRAQITRLVNPDIIVLGGTAAVSSAVLKELGALTTGTVKRVSGANRYSTSVAVSSEAFTTAGSVFLATGRAFPDALGAAPAATTLGAPILLTTAACAPIEVIAEITRLGATRVIVLGGVNAISDSAARLTPCR